MHAAADRPEFAPPPQPGLLRSFVLAVLAHLLLLLALTHGLRWQREAQDAAVEAELWSAVPQQAAPREVPAPPPPPQPEVKAPPQPEPPAKSEADIALERERQKALADRQRQEELERQRAKAQKKREQELARQKDEQAKQLAEAKRRAEEKERKARQEQQALLDERKRQQIREDNMKRMQAMAGGTGAPSATGTAARSSGPSASWAGKVQARVRPNIVFSDDVPGNPEAQVEVRLGPGGLIIGTPRLVKSSGFKSWDDAVLRALAKTQSLPADSDGHYPSPVIISFKPKS